MAQSSRATSVTGRKHLAIDVHTHVYPPVYMDMLRIRDTIPRIIPAPDGSERLLILPIDTSGRPIGEEYWSMEHDIGISVISLANPWLDFLEDGADMAIKVNNQLEEMCAQDGQNRIYCYAALPSNVEDAVKEVHRVAHNLPHMRGVIMGTRSLDDPEKDSLWQALREHDFLVFVHPHYVVGQQEMCGRNGDVSRFGHALDLALGFPFDTSIGVAKMILTGVMERFPDLRVLVSHAGGTLPYLAGRLDSCVELDHALGRNPLPKKPSEYLKMLYYDAISYQAPTLKQLIEFVGPERIMFGTDHPFFSPLSGADPSIPWTSVTKNYAAMDGSTTEMSALSKAIVYENATRLLRLPSHEDMEAFCVAANQVKKRRIEDPTGPSGKATNIY